MSKSLKEQLLAAGLVQQKQVHQVEKEKHKQARQQPKPKATAKAPLTAAQLEAQKVQAEKAARDRELNRQRQADRERRAIIVQLEQIIDGAKLDTKSGETPFRFVIKGKIKKNLRDRRAACGAGQRHTRGGALSRGAGGGDA